MKALVKHEATPGLWMDDVTAACFAVCRLTYRFDGEF